jgi:presenilin enhancer 2
MDLNSAKVTDSDKLALCRKYFYLGFAMLPFLWAINSVWFFKEGFVRKPEFPEQPQIKRFVIMSGIGSLTFLTVLITWFAVFVNLRADWGELGDRLSFNIPTGVR